MARCKPRYACRPAGTTLAPAYGEYPVDSMPAPREVPLLLCHIHWAWARAVIDNGEAVALVVDRADLRALIDAVQARLGHALVIRISDDDVLWVARPWALEAAERPQTE